MKIIIIGGVAGGASCAARLRRLLEDSEIILLERGEHISFANCGLPYYIGGEIVAESQLKLQTPQSFHARFNVDVRVLSNALAIDPAGKTVTVQHAGETYHESYDSLVLAPGAEPIRPDVPGLDLPGVFTLRSIPDAARIKRFVQQEKPRRAVVVGGGFIGLEMAENLVRAGLEVCVVEMADQLLPPLDRDVACELVPYLRRAGVTLKLGAQLTGIEGTLGGRLTVETTAGAVSADMVVLSVGVRPESGLARDAGLDLDPRGLILVDDHMRTSCDHIYAVGDAVAVRQFVSGQVMGIPLAGPANKQGRVAADQIAGKDSRYDGTQGSAVVKVFDMTVAMTGINEKTCRALGLDYEKSFTFSPSHANYYPGAGSMSVKLLFERRTGKLLGAQIAGFDGVDKRCDVLATAIRLGATARDLARLELCYAPPFGSAKDPVNMAGYAIENVLDGRVRLFHWHDVDGIVRDEGAQRIDVRSEAEYARGRIEGFINIPLDQLRLRLEELEKDRLVYVHCQSGMRSYVACCILSQKGYDCYNLSGGYRLYAATKVNA